MKAEIYFLCVFLTVGLKCKYKSKNDLHFNRISIDFVGKHITSPYSISCDYFESSFKESHRKIVLTEEKYIQYIKNCLLEERESSKLNIDVRAKVSLYDNEKKVAVYCLDAFGHIILNDSVYVQNKCFVEFIDSIRENNMRK